MMPSSAAILPQRELMAFGGQAQLPVVGHEKYDRLFVRFRFTLSVSVFTKVG